MPEYTNNLRTHVVTDAAELPGLLARVSTVSGSVGFDVETSGPSIKWRGKSRPDSFRASLTGFSVSTGDDSWYVPVRHADKVTFGTLPNVGLGAALNFCEALFCEAERGLQLVAFNLGYELQVLRNEGVTLSPYSDHLNDASVTCWLAGWGTSRKLKDLANERYGFDLPDFAKAFGKDAQSCDVSIADMAAYAAKDPWLTCRLHDDAMRVLEQHDLVKHYRDIDMPCVEILRGMKARGQARDREKLEAQRARLLAEMEQLLADFRTKSTTTVMWPTKVRRATGEFFKNGNPKFAVETEDQPVVSGADVSNDHHVSRWLYDELKLWPTTEPDRYRTGKTKERARNGVGNYPCDKETLRLYTLLPGLGGELARMRLEYQARAKLVSTYLDVLIELPEQYADGRVHADYNLTGTVTQRFSSSGPNMQNLPSRSDDGKAMRDALVAAPGKVIVVRDYSQIELRIVAHLSRDPNMCSSYVFCEDNHAKTLVKMRTNYPEATRTDSKITNFSTIYRISAEALAVKMRCTVEQAQASIDAFYETFGKVHDYHTAALAYAEKYGHARTLDGYKRFLEPPRKNKWGKVELTWPTQNEAINTPVQGSAAGMIKIAMVKLHKRWVAKGWLGVKAWIVSQVHDELGSEVDEDIADEAGEDMTWAMETALQLRVPVVAEGGCGLTLAAAKG